VRCNAVKWATSRALQLGIDSAKSDFGFVPPGGVSTGAIHLDKTVTNLRAFGWFGSQATVVRRVVNESAEVADFIGKLYE
jgi:hypothetical protein